MRISRNDTGESFNGLRILALRGYLFVHKLFMFRFQFTDFKLNSLRHFF
jgi:hypothetical protein